MICLIYDKYGRKVAAVAVSRPEDPAAPWPPESISRQHKDTLGVVVTTVYHPTHIPGVYWEGS